MANSDRMNVRISGFGGQGIILMGLILGRAAALYDDRYASLAQNYGPEARGSACRADLIIANDPIDYPRIQTARILIALSQDGYLQNRPTLAKDGILLYDEELVKLREADFVAPDGNGSGTGAPANGGARLASPCLAAIPATRFAKELGGRIMANLVMLGFSIGLTEVVSQQAAEKAVQSSVPKGTETTNLAALHRGIAYAQELLPRLAAECGGAEQAVASGGRGGSWFNKPLTA